MKNTNYDAHDPQISVNFYHKNMYRFRSAQLKLQKTDQKTGLYLIIIIPLNKLKK